MTACRYLLRTVCIAAVLYTTQTPHTVNLTAPPVGVCIDETSYLNHPDGTQTPGGNACL